MKPYSYIIKLLTHLLYWAGYLWLASKMNLGNKPGFSPEEVEPVNFVLWAIWNLPFKWLIFYSYLAFFIPQWFYKKTWRFIGISLLLLIVYPLVKMPLDHWLGIDALYFVEVKLDASNKKGIMIVEYSFRVLTAIGGISMALLFRFITDWFKNMRIQQNMQVLQLQSELDMLRSQINPHFLFNTLNNIDGMIYKVSPEGSDAIGKLAAIMRYMLYESNTPKVSLEKELSYLQSYFELQRLRFRNQEAIQMQIEGNPSAISIAPLLYIPFVENAFKHGVVQENGILLKCLIKIEQHIVFFSIESGYNPNVAQEKDKVGGIGLANVQRRLELLYPNKHELTIKAEPPLYMVELQIDTQ